MKKEFCTNCKETIEVTYLGEERGKVSDMKIEHWGCPKCKSTSGLRLNEIPFKHGLD